MVEALWIHPLERIKAQIIAGLLAKGIPALNSSPDSIFCRLRFSLK